MKECFRRCLFSLGLGLIFLCGQMVSAQTSPQNVWKKDVGTWDAKVKMWVGGPEPMEMAGVEVNYMLGDLWLIGDFKGDFGGTPFAGHSIMGYNEQDKKFQGTWVDTMNPNPMHMDGTYDEATQTLTTFSKQIDPSGTEVKGKSTVVYKDGGRVMTMFMLKPNTKDEWEKNMEIIYTPSKENSKKEGVKAGPAKSQPNSAALNFKMKSIDGDEVDLSQYQGKVVMMVNVASQCGMTPQYEDLQTLYKKYSDQGLVILGFPCNQFGSQEPGTEAQIKEFCSSKYNVTFPMFAKIDVKDSGQCSLYKYLTSVDLKPKGKGDVGWNFEKFIVDRNGQLIARFGSRTNPTDPEVETVLKAALESAH